MKPFKYFLLLDSLFTKWDSRSLVFGCLSLCHLPYCQWFFWSHTLFCLQPQISLALIACLLAFSLWCPISRVTCRIHRISSIWYVVLVYRLVFLLRERLDMVWKTYSQVFCSTSFWCIYYSARFSCLEHSYDFLLLYRRLVSVAPMHKVGFDSKSLSAPLAWQIVC